MATTYQGPGGTGRWASPDPSFLSAKFSNLVAHDLLYLMQMRFCTLGAVRVSLSHEDHLLSVVRLSPWFRPARSSFANGLGLVGRLSAVVFKSADSAGNLQLRC